MDRPDAVKVGIAVAATLALINLVCAVAIALWPTATLDFFGAFAHGLNLTPSTTPVTVGRVAYGVLGLGVVGFVSGVVFTAIYNLLSSK